MQSVWPISLALDALILAEQALGLSKKRKLSMADIAVLQQKSEEIVAELRDQISDPAEKPTLAALRQAIKESIFFQEICRAEDKDAAWFSKNWDRHLRVRAALPHESLPHQRNTYRSIAIVSRKPDGQGGEYHPVLECAVRVGFYDIVDWKDESEIAQIIDLSGWKDAPLH